jgi:hypothetical protein
VQHSLEADEGVIWRTVGFGTTALDDTEDFLERRASTLENL